MATHRDPQMDNMLLARRKQDRPADRAPGYAGSSVYGLRRATASADVLLD